MPFQGPSKWQKAAFSGSITPGVLILVFFWRSFACDSASYSFFHIFQLASVFHTPQGPPHPPQARIPTPRMQHFTQVLKHPEGCFTLSKQAGERKIALPIHAERYSTRTRRAYFGLFFVIKSCKCETCSFYKKYGKNTRIRSNRLFRHRPAQIPGRSSILPPLRRKPSAG